MEKVNEHIINGLKLKGGTYILNELISTKNPANKEKYGLCLEKGKNLFMDVSAKLYERLRAREKSFPSEEKSDKEEASKDEQKYNKEKKQVEVEDNQIVHYQQKKMQNVKRVDNDGFTRVHYPRRPRKRR